MQNRQELAKFLDQDVEFFIKEFRKARQAKIITETEYDTYTINLKRYVHRLGNNIKLNNQKQGD